MKQIRFTKMHGLGNDFVIIDKSNQNINLTTDNVKLICNRKLGIGCDQLLLIKKKHNLINEYNYLIFNNDGSHSEHCGNGARCITKYLYTNDKNLDKQKVIKLHTPNRVINCYATYPYDTITVEMGTPLFSPESLPFIHQSLPKNQYKLTFEGNSIIFGIASVGNPHLIIELEQQAKLNDRKNLEQLAILLQNLDSFPNSVNVNFFYKVSRDNIELLTYERGVGFTEACGTGACATVAYGIQQNILNNTVEVIMTGGTLNIRIEQNNSISMIGVATTVFDGSISL